MTYPSNHEQLILLVEDNETIRHAFALLLEDHGYRVIEAATGGEAIAAVNESKPSLVLMDLGLPDMSGLEATRRIKADPHTRGTVIVAITGHALQSDETACLEAGCAGFLAKPVDAEQLFRTVGEHLAS